MRDSFGKRRKSDPQNPETEEVSQNRINRHVDPEKIDIPLKNNRREREINRAFQRRRDGNDDERSISIGLEEIDEAIQYQFQENFNFHVTQNGESVKVPIIYNTRERWEWAKRNRNLKTVHDKVVFPIIVFERTNISRDTNRENANTLTQQVFDRGVNSTDGVYLASTRYSKRNRYDNFSVLNNRKPQRSYYITGSPNYVQLNYDFEIYTEYMFQLNEILEEISYLSNEYWGDPDNNLFKTYVDGFTLDIDIQNEVRFATGDFSAEVYAYILPDDVADVATSQKVYTISEVEFSEEVVSPEEI